MAAGASVLVFQPPAPISKDLLIIKEPFSLSMSGAPPAGGKVSRRDFLKLMAAAGTVMTFAPYVDWGKFLPNPAGSQSVRAKVELASGKIANVNTFEVNYSE
ncbi:MAG: twin-arginine translocation signal domain-containing protein, partial [Nitrososphaera sp.]